MSVSPCTGHSRGHRLEIPIVRRHIRGHRLDIPIVRIYIRGHMLESTIVSDKLGGTGWKPQ